MGQAQFDKYRAEKDEIERGRSKKQKLKNKEIEREREREEEVIWVELFVCSRGFGVAGWFVICVEGDRKGREEGGQISGRMAKMWDSTSTLFFLCIVVGRAICLYYECSFDSQ